MIVKGQDIFLSLREIAPSSPYSADYLRIRILQKKLRGVKIGREWHTTPEWLQAYVARYAAKVRVPYGQARQFVPLQPEPEPEVAPVVEAVPAVPPAPPKFAKPDIVRRRDFREFSRALAGHLPAKLLLAPIIAGLIFLATAPVTLTPRTWGEVSRDVGSFVIESRVPRPKEIPTLALASLGALADRITSAPASLVGSIRNFFSSLGNRLVGVPSAPAPSPVTAPAPLAAEAPPSISPPAQEVLRVREVVETTEVLRPADLSRFQAELDQLNAGLRSQVLKLVSDVANLSEVASQKTTIQTAFAPAQRINQLRDLSVEGGLTLRSGDLTVSAGTVSFAGSGSVSGNLTVSGALTAAGLNTGGVLSTSGTGTSTFAGALGVGTSTPSQLFSVGGSGYLSGGLGVGTATTSPGGLQTSGMAVIGSSLDVRGSATSTFSGPVSIAGILTVNASALTISSTSTVTTQFTITRAPETAHTFATWSTGVANSAVTDAPLLVNPASAASDTNLLGLAIGGAPRFLVDAEGDVYARNLILEGATTQASTQVAGAITVEGNATFGDAANADTHLIRGATLLFSTTTPAAALTVWNSDTGDLLRLRAGTAATERFTFTAGGNLGIGSTTPAVGLSVATSTYVTAGLGVGTATTSSGGLQITGMGVIGSILDVRGGATSTFAGGLSAAGLASSAGLRVSAGDAIFAGGINVAGAATSSITGGLSVGSSSGGLSVANGLAVTSGLLDARGVGLLAGTLGVGTTSPAATLGVSGSGYLTGGLGVGYATTGSGNLLVNDLAVIRGRIGISGTSSPTVEFGLAGSGYLTGGLGVGFATTGPGQLHVAGAATFEQELLVLGKIVNTSAGTSTFSGGVSTAGLASSAGLRVSAGDAIFAGGINVAGAATSSITGGLSVGSSSGGLSVANGLAVTSGLLDARAVGLLAGTLGVGTSSPGTALGVTGAGVFTDSLAAKIFKATSTSEASLFPIASTTSFSVANLLTVAGAGTSTYTGGISTAGLSSSAGLTLSGGTLLGANIGAALGTSTFNSVFAALGGPGAPSYSFSGDPNTGLYSSAADTLNLATAGAERLRLDSSGRIGIASTAPFAELSVEADSAVSTATSTPFFAVGDSGTSTPMFLVSGGAGFVGIGTSSPSLRLAVAGPVLYGGAGATSTNVGAGDVREHLRVGSLEIAGACKGCPAGSPGGADTQVQFNDSGSFGGDAQLTYNKTTDLLTLSFASSTAISVSNLLTVAGAGASTFAGSLGVGTTSPGAVLAVKGPFLAQATSTIEGAGLIAQALAGTSTLAFYTAGAAAPRMFIDGSGNVGIGTKANLTEDLEVNGSIRATGAVAGAAASSATFAFTSGQTEISSRGANASTRGGFTIRTNTSDDSTNAISVSINSSGKIGLGQAGNQEATVQITGGGLCVGSDANCNTDNDTEGTVYSGSTSMTLYDVAENYPTRDPTLAPEEIVVLDSTRGVFVKRAEKQSEVLLGVVSGKPAVHLGGFNGEQFKEERQVAVALSGRVPVKVSTESGPIAIGDRITSSSLPGIGMKAATSGQTVGIALEPFDGANATTTATVNSQEVKTGKVLVFVNLGYHKLDTNTPMLTNDTNALWTVDQQSGKITTAYGLDLKGNDIANVKAILSANGSWSIDASGNLIAESVESRKGFTTYDTATGQPYCIRVTNGAAVTLAGKCSELPLATTQASGETSPIAAPAEPAAESASTTPATGTTTTELAPNAEPAAASATTTETASPETTAAPPSS